MVPNNEADYKFVTILKRYKDITKMWEAESILIQKGFKDADFLLSFNVKHTEVKPFHIFMRYIDQRNYLVIRINDDDESKISVVQVTNNIHKNVGE